MIHFVSDFFYKLRMAIELNNISADSDWGNEAGKINSNNQKLVSEIIKAQNSEGFIKYYDTSDILISTRPTPNDGEQAWAGTLYPGTVWSASSGVWSDTGVVPDVNGVDLTQYTLNGGSSKTTQQLDDSKADKTDIKTKISFPNSGYLNNGVVVSSSAWVYSGYYAVKDIIGITGNFDSGTYDAIGLYDKYKRFISKVAITSHVSDLITQITDSNAVLARFTVNVNQKETVFVTTNLMLQDAELIDKTKDVNRSNLDTSNIRFNANGYINTSGVVTLGVASWYYSDYIPLQGIPIEFILSTYTQSGTYNIISFYKKDYTYISGYSSLVYSPNILPVTTPADAYFYRINKQVQQPVISVKTEDLLSIINKVDITDTVEYKDGYYLQKYTATPIASSVWNIGKLKVEPNSWYYLKMGFGSGTYTDILYMDKSGIDLNASAFQSATAVTDKIIYTPELCEYIAFTINTAQKAVLKVTTSVHTANKAALRKKPEASGFIVLPQYIDVAVDQHGVIFYDGMTSDIISDGSVSTVAETHATSNNAVQKRSRSIQYYQNGSVTKDTQFLNAYRYKKYYQLIESKQTNIRTHAKNGDGSTKNILIIGDSLIDSNYVANELKRMLDADADYVINFVGTRGDTAKHEGRGGWTWSNYVNDNTVGSVTNAFRIGGELNFQQYCIDNRLATPDYVIIALGTNDVTLGYNIYNYLYYKNGVCATAKTFIDALTSNDKGFPNAKIAIGMPSIGAPYDVFGNRNPDRFRSAIQLLNRAYVELFDNGVYHPNVTCLDHGIWTDRLNSYPSVNSNISSRIAVSEKIITDFIHPTENGYYQWSDAFYGKLRCWMNGML